MKSGKSSSCVKPWINMSEVWRGVQMVGNKKYKKGSKVAWSLLLFKRSDNLGIFVTQIVLLLSHYVMPHPPAVVSNWEEVVWSVISMAGNNLANYMQIISRGSTDLGHEEHLSAIPLVLSASHRESEVSLPVMDMRSVHCSLIKMQGHCTVTVL